MKLRIKGNSLRLRLTRSEVQRLGEQGVVEDRVQFAPDQALVYRLSRDAQATQLAASFADGVIEVRVPERLAREWWDTDLVTLSDSRPIGDGELRIVVEKDFACVTPREGEDESDNFPHPAAAGGKHNC